MLEIKSIPQWICWDLVSASDGKKIKIPKTKWGETCGSSWTSSYCTYEEAAEAATRQGIGIGWCFTPEDPYCGIDLDDCLEDGKPKDWAKPIFERLTHTYHEVSPSGRGVKAWLRGSLIEGWKLKADVFGEDNERVGRIELFGQAYHYFTFTGQPYIDSVDRIGDAFTIIPWLLGQYFERKEVRKPRTAWTAKSLLSISHEQRLRDYADKFDLPSAAERRRNDCAFRYAGHLVSLMEDGRPPDDEMVLRIMQEWNDRLPEPLCDAELETAVRSGLRNGQAREQQELPALPEVIPSTSGVDLTKFLMGEEEDSDEQEQQEERKNEKQVAPPADADLEFPADLLLAPGFLGEFVAAVLATSIYPQPQLALSTALAFLGVLCGRKVAGPRDVRTNLYCLHVAPAGSGKDWPRKFAKILEHRAGAKVLGGEDIGSGQGLYKSMAAQPATLMQVDEAATILGSASERDQWIKAIGRGLLKAYSSSSSTITGPVVSDLAKVVKIDQPCLSIIATTTAEELWRTVKIAQVYDGLLPRMTCFTGRYELSHDARDVEDVDLSSLVSQCQWWSEHPYGPKNDPLEEMHPQPRRVAFSEQASTRFASHCESIAERRQKEGNVSAAVWSRSAERSAKLGLLFAISRDRETKTIEKEDIDRGIKLSNWTTRYMLSQIRRHLFDGETKFERDLLRVLYVIRQEPKGLTKTQLFDRTRWLDRKSREDILKTLLDARQIEHQEDLRDRKKANGRSTGKVKVAVFVAR